MTVEELIELLKGADRNALVVLSKDSEGNGYRECCAVETDNNRFDEDEGAIGLGHLTKDLEDLGYCEDDVFEHGEDCVVLY